MTTLDERIARHRELTQQREEISRELQLLTDELQSELKSVLGGLTTGSAPKTAAKSKSVRKCGKCGAEGHNSKTEVDPMHRTTWAGLLVGLWAAPIS